MSQNLIPHRTSLTLHASFATTDWLLIPLLVALVLPLRLWLLCNTEVTARDSIGYIRYALQFEKKPWQDVLKDNHQHPGYPVFVWLTSLPVRALDGATTPENMELSAQLVNLVASLLLILPMYLLGRQFFDRPVSFGATLLYQYLPVSAQHLSDGISEPMFLVLLVSGLLQAVHAVRDRQPWRCALCGVFTGLAYLTRPEGALILPAALAMLIILQVRADWRCPWRHFFACGFAMVLTTLLIGALYVAATGRITNKLSAIETLTNLWSLVVDLLFSKSTQGAAVGTSHLFAISFPTTDDKALRLFRSVWALASEVNQGFHYAAGLPALLGLYWSFAALKRNPGFWFLLIFGVLHSFILIALAMSVNYVSDRHVMILVLGGCFFGVAGLRELPRRVLAWIGAGSRQQAAGSRQGREGDGFISHCLPPAACRLLNAPVWFAILFLALIGFCLPKTTQRLHGNRVGNHAAGLWLATHLQEGDIIVDDHAWSHFFAGQVFQEGREPVLAGDLALKCYVVTTRSRDPEIDLRRQTGVLARDAKIVYAWPEQVDLEKARVLVHMQARDSKKNPWRVMPGP